MEYSSADWVSYMDFYKSLKNSFLFLLIFFYISYKNKLCCLNEAESLQLSCKAFDQISLRREIETIDFKMFYK